MVKLVEEKTKEHLEREGLGSPMEDNVTVKTILTRILANQGGFIEGSLESSVKKISEEIHNMVSDVVKVIAT